MAAHLPGNATVSSHPCLRAKLSKLRSSQTTSARDIKALVNDIAIIVGCEAFAKTLKVEPSGKVSLSGSHVKQRSAPNSSTDFARMRHP